MVYLSDAGFNTVLAARRFAPMPLALASSHPPGVLARSTDFFAHRKARLRAEQRFRPSCLCTPDIRSTTSRRCAPLLSSLSSGRKGGLPGEGNVPRRPQAAFLRPRPWRATLRPARRRKRSRTLVTLALAALFGKISCCAAGKSIQPFGLPWVFPIRSALIPPVRLCSRFSLRNMLHSLAEDGLHMPVRQ